MAEIIPNKTTCGKRKEQPTPPTPKPAVVLCELSGVTYFKLRSDIPGDYTKNCGLLGDEIDKNFYFLRSMDIKNAYTTMEDGRKILVLERVNCGKDIRVDITDEDAYDHEFRVEDGYIYVKYPDGEEDPIRDGNGTRGDGKPVRFLVEGENVRIISDASIDGDGSYKNPVGVDLAYRTGTYMPADFFVDLTCPDATISDVAEGIGNGHAIVTKENMSRFGALYTFGQAKKINEALANEGRGWRLPSKEDWAKLLNWAEEEDEYRNHDTDRSGNLGCVAGARLKTVTLWKNKQNNRDDFGFSIYPVGSCPETYNTREPEDYGFAGLYKTSTFWTSSEKDGEIYTRKFSYGHDDVYQGTESPACRFSIRLVMDVVDDYDITDYAHILGNYVPTVLTTDGKQLWTSLNIDFTNYDGFNQNEVTVPEAWKDVDTDVPAERYYKLVENDDVYSYEEIAAYEIPSTATPVEVEEVPENPTADSDPYIWVGYIIHIDMTTEAKFFYNAWDGKRWHKKLMKEGESVVLLNEDYPNPCDTAATPYVTEDNKNHEWRIYVNEQTGLDELVDILNALAGDLAEQLRKIREAIAKLTEDLANLTETVEGLQEDVEEMQNELDNLQSQIDEEVSARTEADEALWDALNDEISARTEADEDLQEQIDELKSKTIEPGDDSIIVETVDNKTLIRVALDGEDEHLKLGDNGIYFDGDFGLI